MYQLVVIDDEYMVVEGIKAMLPRISLDYEVTGWAYDGIAGLQVIQEKKPDIVITDIRIPGLDGLSLVEAAKEFCPNTTFLIISGYTEFEYARRALALGVRGYIDKPISIQKLKDVLERVEKERRDRQEKSEREETRRAQSAELEVLFDESVKALTNQQLEAFTECTEKTIAMMCVAYQEDMVLLRREVYKYLSVLSDILKENVGNISRESLVSFREMENQTTQEEILCYARSVISEIGKYITADQSGSGHRVIVELLEYIECHYQEDIGLNELAERAQMSTAYLSVLFKSEVGKSYVKYITDLRVKKAKELLKSGHRVNEVSEMVGYSNYRYFSDIFKRHVGQTPNEYKNTIWQNDTKN